MSLPPPALPPSTSLPLPDPAAYEGEPREYARALMQRKDEIEREIDTLKDVLSSQGANASTPLIDPEGYPRGDIDIYAIRHARSAHARLNTDHREVQALLASALEAAFAAPSTSSTPASHLPNGLPNGPAGRTGGPRTGGTGVVDGQERVDMPEQWPDRAVARVNTVAAGSPAAEADLRAGDMIYAFSDVLASSPGGITAIGALVQRSEGVALTILVLRDAERLRLRLTPRTGWGGRGSLGCHILPA